MSESSEAPESWISAFVAHVGHEYYCQVDEAFVEDDFNLTGLQSQVPMYKEALETILDVEPDDEDMDEDELDDEEHTNSSDASMHDYGRAVGEKRHTRMSETASIVEASADLLYGLIHQRYITSRPGMQRMQEKYDLGHFGTCPRVYCRGARVLPVGCSDIPGLDTVKLFCPACLDVYAPPNSRFQNVDGAFFGTTFGCLFFMTFPDYNVGGTRAMDNLSGGGSHPPKPHPELINGVSISNLAPGLSNTSLYQPRIYGFKVSTLAKTGPRMSWLRRKPADIRELDEAEYMDRVNEAMEDKDGSEQDSEDEDEESEEEEEEEEEEEGGGEATAADIANVDRLIEEEEEALAAEAAKDAASEAGETEQPNEAASATGSSNTRSKTRQRAKSNNGDSGGAAVS